MTKEIAQGAGCTCGGSNGQGTYLFSYSTNTNAGYSDGYNTWKFKTVVQFDETFTSTHLYTNTVYSNYEGEVMLNVFTDVSDPGNSSLNGDNWGTFYKYDGAGRIVWTAEPSALALPSTISTLDAYNDVLDSVSGNYSYMNDSSGLIHVYDYYSGLTGSLSPKNGYLEDVSVQNGETASPVLQETRDYSIHTYVPTGSSIGDTIVPLASDTIYGGTGGTDARTTSYAYTYQLEAGSLTNYTNQFATCVTTLPVISATQNGPNVADTMTDAFDVYGRVTQYTDADGFVTTYAYDDGTGAMTQMVVDSGVGHLNLTTSYVVDGLGRTTQETDPNGNVTYTVYNDTNHEARVYPGWNSTSHTTTGPIQVSRTFYPTGSGQTLYDETLTSSAVPSYNGTTNAPTGTETIDASNIQTLSRGLTNKAGQLIESDDYFSMSGVTYSQTAATLGSSSNTSDSGNYHATTYGYDGEGNQNRMLAPTGTITRTIYDNLARIVSQWVGTDDTPSSGFWSPSNNSSPCNMIEVEDDVYDGGGVGDGNLTQVTDHTGGSAPDRVSQYAYDWRDRLVEAKGGVQTTEGTTTHRPIVYTTYDNADEVTEQQSYDGDTVQLSSLGSTSGVPNAPSSSLLRSESTSSYDDQGRVYQTQTFSVDPSSGAVSTYAITGNTFYDHRGNVIADYGTQQPNDQVGV